MLKEWGVYDFLGITDDDIYVIITLYVLMAIPAYLLVRTALFLILPKSWLKWLFRI